MEELLTYWRPTPQKDPSPITDLGQKLTQKSKS